jgi:hypothetical protein
MSDEIWIAGVVVIAVATLLWFSRGSIRDLLDNAAEGIRAFRDRL